MFLFILDVFMLSNYLTNRLQISFKFSQLVEITISMKHILYIEIIDDFILVN